MRQNDSERKIKQIKAKLIQLISRRTMLPGGISQHWNVCGKANCRCKDPKRPLKHGPYYQLSFTLEGRSSSFFVKEKDLLQARQLIQNHQQFRKFLTALLQRYIRFIRQRGFPGS